MRREDVQTAAAYQQDSATACPSAGEVLWPINTSALNIHSISVLRVGNGVGGTYVGIEGESDHCEEDDAE